MLIDELRDRANRLPMDPGVYIMMDKSGDVIYVGKAKHLKNRVSSYFHGSHNTKTEAMISKIADFDIIIANSEFEALVLENSLIKHHMPKYNILLKDDKGYPFVRLDKKSLYPKFTVAAKTADDGAIYFGPFKSRGSVNSAIDSVSKALKLPTCRKKFPQDIGRTRPCLNYHMGHCRGYCLKDATREEYMESINAAAMIFAGKADSIEQEISANMEKAAEMLQFELAAEYRDRMRAVQLLKTKQLVWSATGVDTDVVGFYRGNTKSCFVVLHYMEGKLLDKDYEMVETPMEDDGEAVSSLIRQYYMINTAIPKNILLSVDVPDMDALCRFINEAAGFKVYLTVPKKGEKLNLVKTAVINAREEIERSTTKEEKVVGTALWLQNALGLSVPPERIESFDISNTGNSDIVSSMVVFYKGKPLKSAYRKFKIKEQDGQDDYGSMAETLRRRLQRFADGDEKFSPLPDLMLIDGGELHAKVADAVVNEFGYDIPVFGMVKDDRHRTRALISPDGEEVGIMTQQFIFSFIGTIQEETHRFAIEFHRNLHSKNAMRSKLDEIHGVGEIRKNQLIKKFKSIKAIAAAEISELSEVVPVNTAESIYAFFHKTEENDK